MHATKNVIVLGGGPGLGFYIPGLIVHKQLKSRGIFSKMYAYENLIKSEKRENFVKAKTSFHRDFKFALISQKLTRSVTEHVDQTLLEELFNEWDRIEQKYFVVFSGFWTAILELYITEQNSNELHVDLCHVDAAESSSWSLTKSEMPCYKHVWFFNWKEAKVSYYINIDDTEPLPYISRNNRFLIHGGGWGIGRYKEVIPVLEDRGYALDILNYEYPDLNKNGSTNNRYYMIDPTWHHWLKDERGDLQFPPFAKVVNGAEPKFTKANEYPEIYSIIKNSKAIISKPGAGTLLDSLSSATPLILLAPFGDYEEKNGLLWEKYKLGIPFEKWADSDYSSDLLEELHHNLIALRGQTKNYLKDLVCNLKPQ
jgi:hypothetical protein